MCRTSLKLLLSVPLYCGLATTAERYQASEPHMGSMVSITLYAETPDQAQHAFAAAFNRIAELNRILSDYDPKSELALACRDNAAKASPDLLAVVTKAQDFASATSGAFDITVGPLTELWRRARQTKELPGNAEIEEARGRSGYRKLSVDDGIVRCATLGMRLDAGGIAKGYAADEALAAIRKAGVGSALVAVSGDIAIGDPPAGREGWRVKVLGETRTLANCAVSTSGDEFQFVVLSGARYSHIIDPRTGMALQHSITVAVIAKRAMDSDALATAISVAGVEGADTIAAAYNAKILIEDRTGRIRSYEP